MGTIEIDTNLIPYSFEVELSQKIYTISVNYNYIYDFFTIDLMLNGEMLIQGEKMVLNEILFRDAYEDKEHNLNYKFPNELLIPIAVNDSITRITFENLGSDIELYYFERSEIDE
ncbi:phage baseplate plug family protein [Clostridium rectalis]|uniref:phage baseplate plug family protein n=1 Tax=Clostridium rectalis TaxID=2040295 RepID=UPI000F6439A3|nr:hypothetical protein [Clostridium rectalis]